MMPGNTYVAVTPNLNSSHANAFSLFQHFNQNTDSHSISCEYGSYHKACSLNSILISLADEMSLYFGTLVIMSLKLLIWCVSLPLRRSMFSCLTSRSSFSLMILSLIFFHMSSLYFGLSGIIIQYNYSVLRLVPPNDVSCLHSGCQVDLLPGVKGMVSPFLHLIMIAEKINFNCLPLFIVLLKR